jgi:mono/diheme cytochrome c family protein
MDFLSRDIAIVDVSGNDPTLYKTLARVQSADLPAANTDAATVLRGKYLFNSAIGPVGAQPNSVRPSGRMSDTGWGTCYSCHPNGLTDTVTWMFADGPRQAISMESTFEFGAAKIVNGVPVLPDSHQRALNWSAVRDEVEDFTRNVRAVSGGGGLVTVAANSAPVPEGAAGLAQLPDLLPTANSGLNADLDAIATYLALGVRAPISPIRNGNFGAQIGRAIFEVQGCQNCHGGKNWTISSLDYTPPPVATDVVDAQLVRFLCRVGTFDPALFTDGVSNEIRANNAANVQARGVLGINVPSLISVFSSAPYLHSGAAASLDDVLLNVTHRTAGRADHLDILNVPLFRRFLVQFLRSIDRDTPPILNVNPPIDACGPQ